MTTSFGTITIQKGQGITQGLKALVDKLSQEGKAEVGKIDWSKTIDKLSDIQKHRTDANTNSVFRGDTPPVGTGTNKNINWQKNMVVDKGNIEFSDDEMQELFEAMGVKIKVSEKDSKPEAQKPAATGSTATGSTSTAGATATTAIPAENVKKESKIPGTVYQDGEEVSKDKAGHFIKKYKAEVEAENGTKELKNHNEYYDSHNKIAKAKVFKADGKLDYISYFDAKTENESTRKVMDDYGVDEVYKYKYDPETGRQMERIEYGRDGTIFGVIKYEYDSKTGKKVKDTKYDDEKGEKAIAYMSEYDSNTGKIVKDTTFDKDKSIGGITKYEYDPNTGKRVRTTDYDQDMKIYNITEYAPETGKQVKFTVYQDDGKTINWVGVGDRDQDDYYEIVYKKDGKRIDYIERYEYETNTNGNKILKDSPRTYYKEDGKSVDYELTEYNRSLGQRMQKIVYKADGKTVDHYEKFNTTTKEYEKINSTSEPKIAVPVKTNELSEVFTMKNGLSIIGFEDPDSNNHKVSSSDSFINGPLVNPEGEFEGGYIENGNQIKDWVDPARSSGNFAYQNGVIGCTNEGKMFLQGYSKDMKIGKKDIKWAFQNGPILLQNGENINNANSKNVNIRSGIGFKANGELVTIVSKDKMTFYDFAELFQKEGCTNAIYLDGSPEKSDNDYVGYKISDKHDAMIKHRKSLFFKLD